MEVVTRIAWLALAAVHLTPAAVVVVPSLVSRLYGVEPTGDLGIILTHRGALFLAVVAAATLAAFHPPSRVAAFVVVAISMGGFLALYGAAGFPEGPMRKIALTDFAALLPLAVVGLGVVQGR